MRIIDSAIQFSSARQYAAQQSRHESVKAWVGPQRPTEGKAPTPGTAEIAYDRTSTRSLSEAEQFRSGPATAWPPPAGVLPPNLTRLLETRPRSTRPAQSAIPRPTSIAPPDAGAAATSDDIAETDPESRMLKLILLWMMGVRNDDSSPQPAPRAAMPGAAKTPQATPPSATETNAPQRQGWGAEIGVEDRYSEAETTAFDARGVVKTADGQSIPFRLDLTMQRAFVRESRVTLKTGDAAIDPLVINFDGTAAQLSEIRFAFDLQGDGKAESVPTLGQGSGFLALDKNGDGKITDGSELFGPRSGNGFTELSRYDADGNRWIDENDPVYTRLRVWQPDADGTGALATLQEAQIGAIYLQSAQTPFAIKTAENALLGQVATSGVYLAESGRVGTVQQVDLAI